MEIFLEDFLQSCKVNKPFITIFITSHITSNANFADNKEISAPSLLTTWGPPPKIFLGSMKDF